MGKVGNKNIAKDGEATQFKKGDPRINRKGRPRKLISSVIKEMKESGVQEATKQDILSAYMMLINLEIPEIEDKVKDKKSPALIRIVGKAILSGKGFDIIEKMLDRSIGRSTEKIETDITSKGQVIQFQLPKNNR